MQEGRQKLCLKNNGWTSYYFKDINGDGLDEFVIFAGNEAAGYQLYTCKTGKAKRLMSISHGLYSKYYKGSKVLYTDCSHMGYTTHAYYKWSNKKIGSPVAVKRTDTNPVAQGAKAVVTYEVKGKKLYYSKYRYKNGVSQYRVYCCPVKGGKKQGGYRMG